MKTDQYTRNSCRVRNFGRRFHFEISLSAKAVLLYLPALFFTIHNANASKRLLHPAPRPEYSILNLCVGDTAVFINHTVGGISYKWILSVADTVQNTLQPIDSAATTDYSFYFSAPGVFELTLYADNGHLTSLSRTLEVGSVTKADFDFLECANQFVNLSSCAEKFFWNFGDGDTSSLPIPNHQYQDTGTYIVKLKVWQGQLIDSLSKPVTVDVIGYPDPTFTVVSSGYSFTAGLLNPPSPGGFIQWYFGDSLSANTGSVVTHVFTDSLLSYQIKVFMANECGLNLSDTTIFVDIFLDMQDRTRAYLSVFPSPSNGNITVVAAAIQRIDLYDSFGRLVKSTSLEAPLDFAECEYTDLHSGVYVLSVYTATGSFRKAIIKQ